MNKPIFFASGPSKKFPEWNSQIFNNEYLGRTHYSDFKQVSKECLDMMREILEIPDGHQIFFVPGSGSGAIFCSYINCLLPNQPVQIAISGYFATEWANDIENQFKISCARLDYNDNTYQNFEKQIDKKKDYVLVSANTKNGMRNLCIPDNMEGLVLTDAVSAAFLEELEWSKLDCIAFSAQKVLGGDGSLGILVLSPKAQERVKQEKSWPVIRMFNINKWNLDELSKGRTMSTPSILAIIELNHILKWIKQMGGLEFLRKRNDMNQAVFNQFMEANTQFEYLIKTPELRSQASTCIQMKNWPKNKIDYLNNIANEAMKLNVYDIENTLESSWRFWLGPMLEASEVEEGLSRFLSVF